MAASTTSKPSAFDRIFAVPLIRDPLNYINSALTKNNYTSSPYNTARGCTLALAEQVQARTPKQFAGLIESADAYANQGLDIAEKQFPAAFKTTPEEVAEEVESTTNGIVDGVKSRSYAVVHRVDSVLAPFMDFYAAQVKKITPASEGTVESPTAQPDFQVQRGYDISLTLLHVALSKFHSAKSQAKNTDARDVSDSASDIGNAFTARVRVLSDAIIDNVYFVQTRSVEAFNQITAPDSMPELNDAITSIRSTLSDKELSAQGKVHVISSEIQKKVGPVLGEIQTKIGEAVGVFTRKAEEVSEEAKQEAIKAKEEVEAQADA